MSILRDVAEVIGFSRSTNLHKVFPQSAGGVRLNPNSISNRVQLVHPALSPGENLPLVANFHLQTAGSPVETSVIPEGTTMYWYALAAFHNDPVARRCLITLREDNTGLETELYDSAADISNFAGAVVPTNVVVCLRNIVQPEGYRLRAHFVGFVPGLASLKGTVAVLGNGETPPPLF